MFSSYTLRSETTVVLRFLSPGIEAAQGNNPPSNWEAVIEQHKPTYRAFGYKYSHENQNKHTVDRSPADEKYEEFLTGLGNYATNPDIWDSVSRFTCGAWPRSLTKGRNDPSSLHIDPLPGNGGPCPASN